MKLIKPTGFGIVEITHSNDKFQVKSLQLFIESVKNRIEIPVNGDILPGKQHTNCADSIVY
jgi:hypothetical protein